MLLEIYGCFNNIFFFKQKTAYEMRISDWSSDVCSSDLRIAHFEHHRDMAAHQVGSRQAATLIRNMDDVDAGLFAEHLARQVVGAAHARRTERPLAGLLPGQGHKRLQVLYRPGIFTAERQRTVFDPDERLQVAGGVQWNGRPT